MTAKRITITLQPEVLEKLDGLAKSSGMKRSAIVAMLVNEAVLTKEMTAAQLLQLAEDEDAFKEFLEAVKSK